MNNQAQGQLVKCAATPDNSLWNAQPPCFGDRPFVQLHAINAGAALGNQHVTRLFGRLLAQAESQLPGEIARQLDKFEDEFAKKYA